MKYVHFCRRRIISMEPQNKRTLLDFERRFRSKDVWRFPHRRSRQPTSFTLLVLELHLLPLTDPVQVNLIAHSHGHHDPHHRAETGAEDPHGLRRSAPHSAGRRSNWAEIGERLVHLCYSHTCGPKDPSTHGWWRWSSHWWARSPRCTTRSELWKCWPSGSCWRCTDASPEAARSPSSPSLRGAQPCGWWASELGVQGSRRRSGSQSGSRSPDPLRPPPSSAAACWNWLQNSHKHSVL